MGARAPGPRVVGAREVGQRVRARGWAVTGRRPDHPSRTAAPGKPYCGAMQATVHSFDPTTGSGTVVTDAGVLVPLSPKAFETSALRTLRQGQRLTVTITGRGAQAQVATIAIETVGMVPGNPSRP